MKIVKSDRDSSFDRLLAESLETRLAAAPDGACLDAETLAAWADGALSGQERQAAEVHAAGCARCQQVLAAMVRSTPAPAVVKPAWRRAPLAWAIPLAAAAAAVVLWVVVPGRTPFRQDSSPASIVARTESPAAPNADLPTTFRSEAPPQGGAATSTSAPAKLKASPPAPAASPDTKVEERALPASGELDRRDVDKNEAPSSNANAQAESSRTSNDARRAPAERGAVPPATAAPPASSAAPATTRDAISPAPPPAAGVAKSAFALARAAPAGIIASPDPAIRWRIVPGGGVERSTDGGSSWQAQDTGVTVTLTAGASPSPSVCWLVGPDGTVLVSTDGRSWRRLPFPERAALASVRATDDKIAAVTAADGRTFSTTDGGQSWTRSPAN